MNTKEKIDSIIEKLPPLSPVALQIVELVQDPEADMTQIVDIIEYDPAVTANVLRLANSAYFGGNRSIASLRDAIVRLGLRRIFHVAMAAAVNPIIQVPVEGYGIRWGGLWRHSVAVGLGTEYLSFNLQIDVPGYAFTAGLLHDIGKLIIPELEGWNAERLAELAKSKNISFEQAEKEMFEVNHADVGAMVLDRWNFPVEIIRVVEFHHNPDELETRDVVVDLVHVADLLSIECGFGLGELDGLCYGFSESVMERLKVSDLDKEIVRLQMLSGVEGICGADRWSSSGTAPAD